MEKELEEYYYGVVIKLWVGFFFTVKQLVF